MIDGKWVDEVLTYWFDELGPEGWFEQHEATDETIRKRFATLHEALFQAFPSMAFDDPDSALAAILVFDQFPRNMFRGEGRAFATDDVAAAIARKAIERGLDAGLPGERKLFLYMPLMHAENLADQEHCVALFSALEGNLVKHAVEHRDIVARFGRFPHRNRALGRKSTAAEQAFLAEHEGFGQ